MNPGTDHASSRCRRSFHFTRALVAARLATIVAASLAVSIVFSTSAHAALISDGSFENAAAPGFSGAWTPAGDAGTVVSPLSGTWSSTHGSQFAVMSTGVEGGEDYPMPGSLTPFFTNAIPVGALETALNLPAGSLAADGFVEGSGILHSGFFSPGPGVLTVDFEFLTNEGAPAPPDPDNENDAAFYSLDGGAPVYFYDAFGNFGPLVPSGSADFFKTDSGAAQTLFIAVGAGNHTIAFGVADNIDAIYNSGLYLDNISLVPEPTSLVLGALAALGLAMFRFASKRNRS